MSRVVKILMIVACLSSCSGEDCSSVVMRAEFPNEEWGRFDFLRSTYEIKKAPVVYDIVLKLELSDVFPNIYPYYSDDSDFAMNMTISTPDGGSVRSKEYNFKVKDSDGNFKSDKINGYHTFELPLVKEMTFSEKGLYQFKIENKYTKDPLYGIKSLTIEAFKR